MVSRVPAPDQVLGSVTGSTMQDVAGGACSIRGALVTPRVLPVKGQHSVSNGTSAARLANQARESTLPDEEEVA